MRALVMTFAISLCVAASPATATHLSSGKAESVTPTLVEDAQSYGGRSFRRCMRAKYGPRYFARVHRAHRFHMAQACMA